MRLCPVKCHKHRNGIQSSIFHACGIWLDLTPSRLVGTNLVTDGAELRVGMICRMFHVAIGAPHLHICKWPKYNLKLLHYSRTRHLLVVLLYHRTGHILSSRNIIPPFLEHIRHRFHVQESSVCWIMFPSPQLFAHVGSFLREGTRWSRCNVCSDCYISIYPSDQICLWCSISKDTWSLRSWTATPVVAGRVTFIHRIVDRQPADAPRYEYPLIIAV